MNRAWLLFFGIILGLSGCVSRTAQQVAALAHYRVTEEDRSEEERAFAEMEAIAKKHLRLGMSPAQVRRVMGGPETGAVEEPERVQIWPYLGSYTGTWIYCAVFLDGRLEYFGNLSPQWLGDEIYDSNCPPGIERIQEVFKAQKRAEPVGSENAASPRR
jgi:hypothetical protein